MPFKITHSFKEVPEGQLSFEKTFATLLYDNGEEKQFQRITKERFGEPVNFYYEYSDTTGMLSPRDETFLMLSIFAAVDYQMLKYGQ